ncbi:MAG: AAA family ATPase [Coriobacteriia bacterium]|nr:AAA family ATPase [Coriobacteriia bacterium]
MLTRKITSQLNDWLSQSDRKSLVVKGARQVGKTFSIERFARENFESFIYINFEETPSLKQIFDGDLDTTTLIKQISLYVPGATIVECNTLIFLDEIQSCAEARTALKFMTQDARFDVIASGSLLGINYGEVSSFPVGYTDQIEMHSLDFEEFCWAMGVSPDAFNELRGYYDRREPVPDVIHTKMMQLFKEHIVVGGMPAVVASFAEKSDFGEVLRIQRAIINDYLDDIAKYAKDSEKAKARACFLSIPRQLAKDYKKFQYNIVDKKGSARKYGGSLMWLLDAGIISFCHNLGRIELPLEGNANTDAFKVYLNDTGLLVSMLEDGSQADIIEGKLGIYKGAIYENIIADIFTKNNKRLYYFEYRNSLEIDFVIRHLGVATAMEVKSADNKKSKSMRSVMQNHGATRGIRLTSKNLGSTTFAFDESGGLHVISESNEYVDKEFAQVNDAYGSNVRILDSLPLYMAPFI